MVKNTILGEFNTLKFLNGFAVVASVIPTEFNPQKFLFYVFHEHNKSISHPELKVTGSWL